MHTIKKKRWLLLAAPPVFLAFLALGGVLVMWLWNWLLPPIFGLRAVTFWQALGLLALSRILFGGFGGHGRSLAHAGVRHRMADHWDRMTPEERERLRNAMRSRWGGAAPPDEGAGENR